MPRAVSADVQKLIDNSAADVTLFIDIATNFVDAQLLSYGFSDTTLKYLETFLAAHFAVLALEKGALAEQSIGEAKEKYHNVYKAGLASTRFGQQAITLDTSGTLAEIAAQAEGVPIRKALFSVVSSRSPSEVTW